VTVASVNGEFKVDLEQDLDYGTVNTFVTGSNNGVLRKWVGDAVLADAAEMGCGEPDPAAFQRGLLAALAKAKADPGFRQG
jgi:hypothetical protein